MCLTGLKYQNTREGTLDGVSTSHCEAEEAAPASVVGLWQELSSRPVDPFWYDATCSWFITLLCFNEHTVMGLHLVASQYQAHIFLCPQVSVGLANIGMGLMMSLGTLRYLFPYLSPARKRLTLEISISDSYFVID